MVTENQPLRKKQVRKSQIGNPVLVSSSSDLPTVPVQRQLSAGSRLKLKAASFSKKSERSQGSDRVEVSSMEMSPKVKAPITQAFPGTGMHTICLPKF